MLRTIFAEGGLAMTRIAFAGVDIEKQAFQANGPDREGQTLLRRKLRRNEVGKFRDS